MSVEGYNSSLSELMRRSLCPQAHYREAAKHKKSLTEALNGATSMLTIGPGSGDVDLFMVQMFMPNLRHLYATDVNAICLENFTDTFADIKNSHPDLEIQTIVANTTNWEGPPQQVDVILCFNTLYYFNNVRETLSRMYSWIKPGGFQWLQFNDAGFLADGLRALMAVDRGNLMDVSVPDILDDIGYQQKDSWSWIAGVCVRALNKEFVRMLLQRQPTEDEMKTVQEYVDKNFAHCNYINNFKSLVYLSKK